MAQGTGSRNISCAADRAALLRALREIKRGDFSARLPAGLEGVDGEVARAFNDLAAASEAMAAEEARAGGAKNE